MSEHESNPGRREVEERGSVQRSLELLRAVRQIMQGFDVQSRRLDGESQITLPQLICLMAVVAEEGMTSRRIAAEIFASASTLVGVLDRLEAKQLVDRIRDPRDRRLIHIVPTEAGRRFIAAAPSPLGLRFDERFAALSEARQRQLVEALRLMADLMGSAEPPATKA
jgi:DNA-binding MarR family transcriptional regulator